MWFIWCKTSTKAKKEVTQQMQIRGNVKDDQLECNKQVPLVKYKGSSAMQLTKNEILSTNMRSLALL